MKVCFVRHKSVKKILKLLRVGLQKCTFYVKLRVKCVLNNREFSRLNVNQSEFNAKQSTPFVLASFLRLGDILVF
jgi:hypothetical protein